MRPLLLALLLATAATIAVPPAEAHFETCETEDPRCYVVCVTKHLDATDGYHWCRWNAPP